MLISHKILITIFCNLNNLINNFRKINKPSINSSKFLSNFIINLITFNNNNNSFLMKFKKMILLLKEVKIIFFLFQNLTKSKEIIKVMNSLKIKIKFKIKVNMI